MMAVSVAVLLCGCCAAVLLLSSPCLVQARGESTNDQLYAGGIYNAFHALLPQSRSQFAVMLLGERHLLPSCLQPGPLQLDSGAARGDTRSYLAEAGGEDLEGSQLEWNLIQSFETFIPRQRRLNNITDVLWISRYMPCVECAQKIIGLKTKYNYNLTVAYAEVDPGVANSTGDVETSFENAGIALFKMWSTIVGCQSLDSDKVHCKDTSPRICPPESGGSSGATGLSGLPLRRGLLLTWCSGLVLTVLWTTLQQP